MEALGGGVVCNFDHDASYTYRRFMKRGVSIEIKDFIDSNPDKPTAAEDFWEYVRGVLRKPETAAPVTCLDSITNLVESLVLAHFGNQPNLVVAHEATSKKDKKRKGVFEPACPSLEDWGVVVASLSPLLRQFINMPGIKFITAHDKAIEQKEGGIIGYLPKVPWRNTYARSFASMFTAAGYMEFNTVMNRYKIRFGKLNLVNWTFFRGSDGQVPTIDNTWEEINKILEETE
jgi:hypothetical protein